MALEGPLKELQLHDVFQLLELGRKSGVLRVRSELRQMSAAVCFDHGAVVAAGLGGEPPLLGAVLLRAGKISEDDLVRARALQAGGDRRRLGDILIAMGAVTRRELDRQLKARVEETVVELMGWHDGYFRFEEGAPPGEIGVEAPVRFATEALLMEAARRFDEWSRISTTVAHLGVIPMWPASASAASGRLDLAPFEWELLAAVDGTRDLRELADMLGHPELEVARAVFGLASAGVLILEDPALHHMAEPDPLLLVEGKRLAEVCDAALAHARAALEAWERLDAVPANDALDQLVHQLRSTAAILTNDVGYSRE